MEPESWGFIGTIVGAVVGASASIITTKINSANAIRVQEKIEYNMRTERFREFQRNNLLELQDKLSIAVRLANKAYLEDLKKYDLTKEWRESLLSHELDEGIANSFREISIITERIDDNQLRGEIISFKDAMSIFLLEENYELTEQRQIDLNNKFQNVMPKLGKVLRENY